MIESSCLNDPVQVANSCYATCTFSAEKFHDDLFAKYGVSRPAWLQRANRKRSADYLAGRQCALLALKSLTGSGDPVGQQEDGTPAWPENIVGSISHCGNHAAALVSYRHDFSTVGIDCEAIFESRHNPGLEAQFLGPEELARLGDSDLNRSTLVTIIFSAKESLYKAIHKLRPGPFNPHEFGFLGLQEDQLRLTLADSIMEILPNGTDLVVKYAVVNDIVVTHATHSAGNRP